MSIRDEDLPVQDKHPEWVEWFERNGLDYTRIAVEPHPEYDAEAGTLTMKYYDLSPDGGRVLAGFGKDYAYEFETLTVPVSSTPPWEVRE